jgi:hypothetical protein
MNAPDNPMTIRETAHGLTFPIRVQPRSSRCECAGIEDGTVKLKITAPPVEGRANEECILLLAETLKLKRRQISIAGGLKSRNKVVAVTGLSAPALRERLAALSGTASGTGSPRKHPA